MAFTAADLQTLRSLESKNDVPGYYNFLASKGDLYAPLALGVVTGATPSGATARTFASNVAKITGVDSDGLDSADFKAIAEGLMERDFRVRDALFSAGQSPLNLKYTDIRDYHSAEFGFHGLPPEAWTVFAPFEYSGMTAAQKQAAWQTLLANSGDLTSEAVLGAGLFNAVLTSSYQGLASNAAATQAQIGKALWTEAMLFGADRTQLGGGAASAWFEASGIAEYVRGILDSMDGKIVLQIQIDLPFIDYVIGNGQEAGQGDGWGITSSFNYLDNPSLQSLGILHYTDPGAVPIKVGINPNGTHYFTEYFPDGHFSTKTGTYSGGNITILEVQEHYDFSDSTVTLVYDQFDGSGTPLDIPDVSLTFKSQVYQGEVLGDIFGSQLGALIAGDNVFAQVAGATVGATLAGNIAEYGQSLLTDLPTIPGQSALDIATNATWDDFGKDFTGNLSTQSANVLSSLLFAEVADTLHINGFCRKGFYYHRRQCCQPASQQHHQCHVTYAYDLAERL